MRIGGGEARGRRLKPGRGDVRPTTSRVRSALFSMLGPEGVRGSTVLDLYAGTGSFGIEALSRGAEAAVFVEADPARCREIEAALLDLGYDNRGKVYRGLVTSVLGRLEDRFELIFADPPYGDNPFLPVAETIERNRLLADKGVLFLEHSFRLELPGLLPGVSLKSKRRYGDSAVSVYVKA